MAENNDSQKKEKTEVIVKPLDEQRGETVTHENDRIMQALKDENAAVKAENKSLKDKNTAMKGELKAAKKANDELEAENASLTQVNEALTGQVEEMSSNQPAASDKPKESKETFDIDGVSYRFPHAKIRYQGKRITITEVLASEALQRELLTAGIVKAVD